MKITIPEPCNEDWNKMTSVNFQQRHCAACDRTLTDFTTMTDAEIGAHLRRHKGKICGRIRSTQLNRKLAVNGSRSYGGARAIAAAAGLLLAGPALGQGAPPTQTVWSPPVPGEPDHKPIDDQPGQGVLSDTVTIAGVVTDEYGEPLIGASVLLVGTRTGVVADIDGAFSLKASRSGPISLQISYLGFATLELEVPEAKLKETSPIKYELEVAPVLMSEVVLGYFVRRRSLAYRIFVAPVNRYIVRPVRKTARKIGDWHRGRFDRRAARQRRRNEREATLTEIDQDLPMAPQPQVPIISPVEEVAPVTLNFKASPNPFNDHLKVEFSLAERSTFRLELYDATGKELGRWEDVGEEGPQERTLEHHLGNLPGGMYFLELTTSTTASVLTLVR